MKDGNKRREKILETLQKATKAINAVTLSKEHDVSRQVIVGDIAILRAQGEEIISTNRGYLMENDTSGILKTIPSKHERKDILRELVIIVENGGKVLDVSIDHPFYGNLTGNLNISTTEDIQEFMKVLDNKDANPLLDITGGVHTHKIMVPNEKTYQKIRDELEKAHFLYLGEDE